MTPTPKVTKVDGVVLWRSFECGEVRWNSGKATGLHVSSTRYGEEDYPAPPQDEYVALPRADHDRLVGALAAAQAALEFYADEKHWRDGGFKNGTITHPSIYKDDGAKARAALALSPQAGDDAKDGKGGGA